MTNKFTTTPWEENRRKLNDNEYLILFDKDDVAFLYDENNKIKFLSKNEISTELTMLKIGNVDKNSFFVAELSENIELSSMVKFEPIRHISIEIDSFYANALLYGKMVYYWRRKNKYCSSCANELIDSTIETARVCSKCNMPFYPTNYPAIIVAITNDKNEILLAHNKKFKDGLYSLVAGFVEAGENFEETVHREVFEETGIKVKDIRYFGSQSWPFPASIMVGFTAKYQSGTPRADLVEIADLGFYSKENLPMTPSKGSLAHNLIDNYLKGE